MEPEMKKLLQHIADAILQLRGSLKGSLSTDQEAILESADQAIRASLATDEAKEAADVAGLSGRLDDHETRIKALESAPVATGADADAIDQTLAPPADAAPAAAGEPLAADQTATATPVAPADTTAPSSTDPTAV